MPVCLITLTWKYGSTGGGCGTADCGIDMVTYPPVFPHVWGQSSGGCNSRLRQFDGVAE